jgi:putative flippase GtrA
VEGAGWRPLLANVAGWALAFGVSFSGHFRLTFSASGAALGPAVRRFALISFAGFAVNESAYALLLGLSGASYVLLLGAVLVGVAVGTYVLSRWWAFRHNPARPAPPVR